MTAGIAVLIANIPALLFGAGAGLLIDHGHPWFAVPFLFFAYALIHTSHRDETPKDPSHDQ